MKKSLILSGNAGLIDCRDDKIQLLSCPHECRNCRLVLVDINRLFNESEHYQSSKEYRLSILCLKKAFEKTFEIRERIEQECARLFRFTVIESLENIRHELKKMTSGLFAKSRYKDSYLLAETTLDELIQATPADKPIKMRHSSASHKNEELNLPAV